MRLLYLEAMFGTVMFLGPIANGGERRKPLNGGTMPSREATSI